MLRDVFRMENDLINELVKSKKTLINKLREWRPESNADPVVERIFYKANAKGLKGKGINELISSLSQTKKEEIQEEYYYQKFKEEGEAAIRKMIAFRDELLQQYISGRPLFDSKILGTEKEDMEKAFFMLK